MQPLPSQPYRLLAASLAVALTTLSGHTTLAADSGATAAKVTTSTERISETVKYLSSDALEGRGIGTDGINKAAEYLASEFAALGMKTDLFDGTPFQKFTMTTAARLGSEKENYLRLVGPGEKEPTVIEPKMQMQANTLAVGGSGTFDAPLVFAGYGITAEEHKYDDYADLDVKGKVVIILRKNPGQDNPHGPFSGGPHSSSHAFFRTKLANAATHGAAAVIFINDGPGVVSELERVKKELDKQQKAITKHKAAFAKLDQPSEKKTKEYENKLTAMQERLDTLKEKLSTQGDEIVTFKGAGTGSSHPKLPVYFANRKLIDQAVHAASGKHLAEVEQQIDEQLKPHSFALKDWQAKGETKVLREKVEVKNVIAMLEGEGPHAEETIIIGAHYDHLGFGGQGSLAPWTTEIHNGADDNASGTTAMLELARRLAARKEKLPRRVLFMAFTGEERGLIGSAHYVKNPRFPLSQVVAMLNFDMVGRLTDNKLIMQGVNTATEFEALVDKLNEAHEFKITKKPGGYGPSDHASFYPKQIPVIHFFTDLHKNYHRPSDDFETLNIDGMRRVVDFAEEFAVAIADMPERPTYIELKRPKVARAGKWPYFGSVPDYASDAKGLELKDVAKDGPAAKAGLQAGDIIIRFGKLEVGGIEDFAAALSQSKAGEVVKVLVERGKEKKEFEVLLDKPR